MRQLLLLSFAASVGVAAVAAGAGGCGGDGVPNYPLLMDVCDGSICPNGATAAVTVTSSSGTTSSHASTSSSGSSSSGSTTSGSITSSSSGSSSSSTSSGAGGATTTSDLSGVVDRITMADFSDTGTSFTTAATIAIIPKSGSEVKVPYGGSAGTTFNATGLAPGQAWLFVQDGSMGSANVWSTLSPLQLPQLTSVTLPVIDATLIEQIVATLPSVTTKGVDKTLAHLVLIVEHAGAPYAGLSVSGNTGGALVAYDTGPGTYSDTATATGSAGTILLFDSSLSSLSSITLKDTAQTTFDVPVFAGAGAFTLVSVSQ